MAFIRTVKRENPFVQMDKFFLEDPNLSWESKGILAYILSRPDDWKINQKDLENRSTGAKTKIETALLDLMANGYCHWYQLRVEEGKFGEWVYDVYERPEFNPHVNECIAEGNRRIEERKNRNKKKNQQAKEVEQKTMKEQPKVDYPKPDNPKSDNPLYTNNDLTNNDLTNNKLVSSSSVHTREMVDTKLKEQYSHITHEQFEEVKTELLADETVTINTIKQYQALLTYRLNNWKPRSTNKRKNFSKKYSNSRQVMTTPKWFDDRNKAPEEFGVNPGEENIDFEAERNRILQKLYSS